MANDDPPCDRCIYFDTEKCLTCLWIHEFKLFRKYRSWKVAREQMYQEFKTAKARSKRNIWNDD